MSLHGAIRSLTILLVLEAAIQSQVSAFTIGRTQEPNGFTADLTEAESSQLTVQNDLRSTDVTVINIENVAISQKIVPIVTTAKTEDIQKNFDIPDNVDVEKQAQMTTDLSTVVTSEKILDTSSVTKETITSTQETTSSLKGPKESATTEATELNDSYLTPTTEVDERTTREVTVTTHDSSSNTDATSPQTDIKSSDITTNESTTDTKTEQDNTTSYSTTVKFEETTNTGTPSNKDIDSSSLSPGPSSSSLIPLSDTIATGSDNVDTTTNIESQDTTFAETMTSFGTIIPYRRRYTTIERRRPSSFIPEVIPTEKGEHMIRADTAQPTITLEKAFSITSDIPSLEKLKNDLLNSNGKLDTPQSISPTESEDLSTIGSTLAIVSATLPSQTSTDNSGTTKLDVLTSQRAGFLDYSFKPTITSVPTKTESNVFKIKPSDTVKTTLFDVQDGLRLDKKTSMASQSQLAEDAINEELMKEEMLNDNLEYTKQHREERFDMKTNENVVDFSNTAATAASSQIKEDITQEISLLDDKLSVKPINADKQINTGLYTVNPNYKPLKKIEIQPQKQFVRDPDDNSWRNESISSLGIVFKAKNSSKPFTQVLKNKTETEWNSLLEKYNQSEEPELRKRLEKIAEIRKTKKKKTDKLGETVYSDYEEANASAEIVTKVKSDILEPTISMEDIVTKPSTTESDIRDTTSVVDIDIQKNEELNSFTTQIPPKKQFNVENFEVSEEDDTEYVTLPNIDLKKFMNPAKAAGKPTTTTAQPIKQYLPERKPTVQYFPPRVPQKVNVNDYDEDFQRKVNAFTMKEPKKVLPITYPPQPQIDPEQDRYNLYNRQKTPRPTPGFTRGRRPSHQNYNAPQITPQNTGYAMINPDGSFNRASYVIKHLRDFIHEAAKDGEEDKNLGYIITELPLRGGTTNEFLKENKVKSDYFDYETQFRKDVLDRFVDNFNQNSERFKADFPILYNMSVVHTNVPENGKAQASSSAFIKRLYDVPRVGKSGGYASGSYDPNCERTVELSPEYELHYYVPEQEEKEEIEQKPITIPYRYRIRI